MRIQAIATGSFNIEAAMASPELRQFKSLMARADIHPIKPMTLADVDRRLTGAEISAGIQARAEGRDVARRALGGLTYFSPRSVPFHSAGDRGPVVFREPIGPPLQFRWISSPGANGLPMPGGKLPQPARAGWGLLFFPPGPAPSQAETVGRWRFLGRSLRLGVAHRRRPEIATMHAGIGVILFLLDSAVGDVRLPAGRRLPANPGTGDRPKSIAGPGSPSPLKLESKANARRDRPSAKRNPPWQMSGLRTPRKR